GTRLAQVALERIGEAGVARHLGHFRERLDQLLLGRALLLHLGEVHLPQIFDVHRDIPCWLHQARAVVAPRGRRLEAGPVCGTEGAPGGSPPRATPGSPLLSLAQAAPQEAMSAPGRVGARPSSESDEASDICDATRRMLTDAIPAPRSAPSARGPSLSRTEPMKTGRAHPYPPPARLRRAR